VQTLLKKNSNQSCRHYRQFEAKQLYIRAKIYNCNMLYLQKMTDKCNLRTHECLLTILPMCPLR